MRRITSSIQAVFILAFTFYTVSAASQAADTLFLNANWRICEKPLASYYRFSRIIIDTNWYYQGRVLDFYMNDTLQMDGNYSFIGLKEGLFRFYYPDGKLMTRGQYMNNERIGIWDNFYSNGELQIKTEYAGDGKNFTVLEYHDSTGKVLAKDGTGKFEITISYWNNMGTYKLVGEIKNGKKAGIWNYYQFHPILKEEVVVIKEVYENGELKKGNTFLVYPTQGVFNTYKKTNERIHFAEFAKFKMTEFFGKDPISFKNTDDDSDLLRYLTTRQIPAYDAAGSSYFESIAGVLNKLNTLTILKFFSDSTKLYGGEIMFTLTDSGNIKEVDITGNVSEKEKAYMEFFLKKFKNIEEITGEYAEESKDHKIYFFSLITGDFIPYRYLLYLPEKQFIFSPWPYRATIEKLKIIWKKHR
jgi:antitoxin component YwqK of YwqJK toxin-antitoxin module